MFSVFYLLPFAFSGHVIAPLSFVSLSHWQITYFVRTDVLPPYFQAIAWSPAQTCGIDDFLTHFPFIVTNTGTTSDKIPEWTGSCSHGLFMTL
jgi:hypothetical protein